MNPLIPSVFLSLAAGSSIAQSSSIYDTATPFYDGALRQLTIPLLDTSSGPGLFQPGTHQNAVLKQDGDVWRLQYVTQGTQPDIETIELVQTTTAPVQVFLRLKARARCGLPVVDSHSLRGNTFYFGVALDSRIYGLLDCIAIQPTLFETVIPVPVYGLLAGTYTVQVNGKIGGTFTLAARNVLP